MEFEVLYSLLFAQMIASNREMLGVCHEVEIRDLLLKQEEILYKSAEQYFEIMRKRFPLKPGR